MRVYTTNNLAQLAGRAPTDAQLMQKGRLRKHVQHARESHIVSLMRYCSRRAAFYQRVEQDRLALAYDEFASQLRALLLD